MKRSEFIKTSLLATLAISSFPLACTKAQELAIVLPDLPYAHDALQPVIDKRTMEIHHSKHHQGYVNKLIKALDGIDRTDLTLEDLIRNISEYSIAVRNNAGGHYNHLLFWTNLTPRKNTKPAEDLLNAIHEEFGSMEKLKEVFIQAAKSRFGSGWAWLSVDEDEKLFVSSTPNQDNPMMDIADQPGVPLLGIDVWEHAYYLNYQNKRGDYLTAIWDIINWEEVSKRFADTK